MTIVADWGDGDSSNLWSATVRGRCCGSPCAARVTHTHTRRLVCPKLFFISLWQGGNQKKKGEIYDSTNDTSPLLFQPRVIDEVRHKSRRRRRRRLCAVSVYRQSDNLLGVPVPVTAIDKVITRTLPVIFFLFIRPNCSSVPKCFYDQLIGTCLCGTMQFWSILGQYPGFDSDTTAAHCEETTVENVLQ